MIIPSSEEYFASTNSISQRILEDAREIREECGKTWGQLSYDEQCGILDEALIFRGNTLEKYLFCPKQEVGFEYFPKLIVPTGQKHVYEDDNGKAEAFSWTDEHSGPFSWKTKSQMNLCYFTENSSKKKLHTSPKPKCPPPPPPRKEKSLDELQSFDPPSVVLGGSSQAFLCELQRKIQERSDGSPPKESSHLFGTAEAQSSPKTKKFPFNFSLIKVKPQFSCGKKPFYSTKILKNDPSSQNLLSDTEIVPKIITQSPSQNIIKPQVPPPPPPDRHTPSTEELTNLIQNENSKANSDADIPKSGFDFLDNW